MTKNWKEISPPQEWVTDLQESLKINRQLCQVLVNRGIRNYAQARDYFRPRLQELHDPWLMKDMEKAVGRIQEALRSGEKILIYGDYDVDGTTAVACMYQFIRSLHPDTGFYIPHRYREGYGISKAGIDYAAENGYQLIIALDCGIKALELIAYSNRLGIDVIVCDHHLPEATLPPAIAILNPKQTDCPYPYKELCGCGVGFKLISALCERMGLAADTAYQFLDLVATAIAADIVPMTGENRILAYYGLERANTAPNPGISALMTLSEAPRPMRISNLLFLIAPRVNAAGRMDEAGKAVQLFIAKDYEAALPFARQLHSDNSDRKQADSGITAEALELIAAQPDWQEYKSTVVYQPHWHKGVVGIVASRLIEKYYRPTVVLTRSGEVVTGSARSVPGFNLYEAIHECRDLLLGYGGHFAAAGLSMEADQVAAFRSKFESVVAARIQPEQLIPEISIDTEITLAEISPAFYNIIRQMEPFGPENDAPVFIARGLTDTGFSKMLREVHLRLVLAQGATTMTAIGFNMADKWELVKDRKPFDMVFCIDESRWNGQVSLQLRIIDIRVAAEHQ
ncbi:single-stranded-DNA-specific exonuclease RecJ [Niabella terrae]